MEAPEKIYIDDFGSELSYNWHTEHCCESDIEYTRTDAFIEKACSWLEDCINNGMWIANDVGSAEKEAIIENFRKYMKEE